MSTPSLRAVGADARQLLTVPAVEGAVAAIGSVLIGLPLGVGLAILSVRVLGLFFTLPPPVVALPIGPLVLLAGGVLLASAVAFGLALARVGRGRSGHAAPRALTPVAKRSADLLLTFS